MADPQKKTLLLVEDDFLITMTEKNLLEKYGCSVIAASTGEEAVIPVLQDFVRSWDYPLPVVEANPYPAFKLHGIL
jgi:CheY-like chemotaxis protein